MKTIRHFIIGTAIVLLILAGGTGGYMYLEGWSFLDALYMTVITISTVGFKEVAPVDASGRIFTMALVSSAWDSRFTWPAPSYRSCWKAIFEPYWGEGDWTAR